MHERRELVFETAHLSFAGVAKWEGGGLIRLY